MPVWPEIVVTKPDSPEVLFAVEVKAGSGDLAVAETQLKDYMVRQSCPVGMLVAPEDTLFFRNLYTGYEADTVRKVAACRTDELLGDMGQAVNVESYLVLRVEQWLEKLPDGGRRSWPPSAQEVIESLVLPAVAGGTIRATGPRWRRTGS